MTVFFDWLSEDEKQRVADLELFDEYEEWRLTCSHYMILCAFKGELSALKEVVLPMCTVNYNIKDQLVYYTWNLRMQTLSSSSCSLKRSEICFTLVEVCMVVQSCALSTI